MGLLSKIFHLLKSRGDATPTEGGKAKPRVRKSAVEKDADNLEEKRNRLRTSDSIDECSSLDSFESARSSEKVDDQENPSNIDVAKRSTPLGLQPRPSIQMIRKKLNLPPDDADLANPPLEQQESQPHGAYYTIGSEAACQSNKLYGAITTSSIEQNEYDASFSIRTPDINFGTTLTAVGAFVAEADRKRENSKPSAALVWNAVNRGYFGKLSTNKSVKIPPGKVTSQNSILSISSIYSPLRSTTSETSILPQAYHDTSPANSPASSSSSCSSEDEFPTHQRRKLQPFVLGTYQFDPDSLPPYQMIETPEKRRPRRNKHARKSRVGSANHQRLAVNAVSNTSGICRQTEVNTSSMIMSSPSSSAIKSYSGDEYDSGSDDEQDIPQLMLLTPGRASSSALNVTTPVQIKQIHSSLIMTSPSSCSAYPPRTFCNAAIAARYLEASFEQAILQKGTAAIAVLPPLAAPTENSKQLVISQPIRQVGFAVSAPSSETYTTNSSDKTLSNAQSYYFKNQSVGMKDFKELGNLTSIFPVDEKNKKEYSTSYAGGDVVRVTSSAKGHLPYDFDTIDGCVNDSSDVMIDPSILGIRGITNLNQAELNTTFMEKNIEKDEIHQSSFSNNRKKISHSLFNANKETSIVCYSGGQEKTGESMVTNQPQSLMDPSSSNENLLLERKRENQWKLKVILLQRMIWCLQDNLEVVLEIEAQSDDFYERCPRYVQSSTYDGPVFVKTMSNEEGIIPGYAESTRTLLIHKLDLICSAIGEDDSDLKDALEFASSLVQRKQKHHNKVTVLEKHGIVRKILGVRDSSKFIMSHWKFIFFTCAFPSSVSQPPYLSPTTLS